MLKWIVGSRTDHPLADMKEARALVADLPAYDCVKALDELTHWLESLTDAEGFKLDRLYEVLDLLDSAAKNHQRKLVHDYLAMPRQQKMQENRLWMCGFKFSKACGDAYLYCVRQHEAGAAGAAAVRKHIPIIVARAIRAFAMQVKWTMLRYGPFEPRLWASIGELYLYAEAGGYTTTPITIYSGVLGGGTVQQEYLKIMMLWASSADVLSPLKQEIAERAVAYVASSFRLEKSAFPGAVYCFDPASDKRPVRMFGTTVTGDNLYYFSPGDAAGRLGSIIPALEKTGALPSDVNLGGTYPGDIVLSVFKHLSVFWSDKPPARGSERRDTNARITVVPGYFQLLDELEHEDNDGLNFNVTNAESWVVENVSDTGYGALVPAATTDWVRVGELIGVQLEGSRQWGVAVVRRVMRDEQRQYHVGIEVISRAVYAIRVGLGLGRDDESAILLSTTPDSNSEVGILVRAGRFNPGTNGDMMIRNRTFTITPTRMVDAGDDFDWAMYKVTRPAQRQVG